MDLTEQPWCIILSGGAVLMLDMVEDGGFSDGTTFGPYDATPLSESCIEMDSRMWEAQWLTGENVAAQAWYIVLSGGGVLVTTDVVVGAYGAIDGIGRWRAAQMVEEYIEDASRLAEWNWLSRVERIQRSRAFRATCRLGAYMFDYIMGEFVSQVTSYAN